MRKLLVVVNMWLVLALGHGASAESPYINKVWEYRPAPGQYVNVLPEYEDGDTEADMRVKADECLSNHEQVVVSLGGWGGYIVFGFDHLVPNIHGEYDLKILGNSFLSDANPNDTTAMGGSAEPGIVMVSYDANQNGRPDDAWYELAGSEHANSATKKNYTVTYSRPAAGHVATPSKVDRHLSDTTYILWSSSEGETGYVEKNTYHTQHYFPQWIESETLSFTGTRLRNNGKDESKNGGYYVQYVFDWGYADNHPNTSDKISHPSEFDIDWAVDESGEKVNLPGIHFVKVYTGVLQQNGWLGECSTEIMDAWDIHAVSSTGVADDVTIRPTKRMENGQLRIEKAGEVYDVVGRRVR